eukprot:3888919-Amphidinium_carterae.1
MLALGLRCGTIVEGASTQAVKQLQKGPHEDPKKGVKNVAKCDKGLLRDKSCADACRSNIMAGS